METKLSWIKGLIWRLALVICVVILVWGTWLNARVVSLLDDFSWQIPAQVFARPLELYQGGPVSQVQLIRELNALGYQQGAPTAPGRYRQKNGKIDLYTRGFLFPDVREAAVKVSLEFDSGQIQQMTGASLVRLEPEQIGTLLPQSGEDRTLLAPEQTPTLLLQGLVAVEDRRFFEHFGVDPRGLARALWANVSAGRVVEGGSTLTQQLVKNLFLDRSRTLSRKINEAAMALLVDWHYDKDFILQAYINQVYLGQAGRRAVHGFAKASQHWFARPIQELGPAQLALLVGMVKGPNAYHPRRNPERATKRRNAVLAVWQREGLLDSKETSRLQASPLGVSQKPGQQLGRYPGFMRQVKSELRSTYEPEALQTQGLQVFTTLDPHVQSTLQQSLKNRLSRFESQGKGQNLQGAGVLIAPATGEVLAMVGDRESLGNGFDRAQDARRPVGSLLKPLVYLYAFERGLNAMSPVQDVPVEIKTADGVWAPSNYDDAFEGQVPLFYALSKSKNLASVNLAQTLGFQQVADTARQAGVDVNPDQPSWILGAHAMSPFEVAQLYATLANDGFEVAPKLIRDVMYPDGRSASRYTTDPSRRLSSDSVYQLQQVLRQVMFAGTGAFLGERLGRPSAGKSGTSNDQRDSWFAGFDGGHVAVVWVGTDDNKATGLTGSSGAGLIWLDLMRSIPGVDLSFRRPSNIQLRWIDELGRLSSSECNNAQQLPVQMDQLPAQGTCGSDGNLWQRFKQIFGGE